MQLIILVITMSFCLLLVAIIGMKSQFYMQDQQQRRRNRESIQREEQRRSREAIRQYRHLQKYNKELPNMN